VRFVAIVVIDNHEVQTYTAPGKNERVASIMSALDARRFNYERA